jgi:hypothetical protein
VCPKLHTRPNNPRREKERNGRKVERFERGRREGSVLGARGLRASFKGKILTLFSLSFLKFQMIYGTWIYYFEIYVVCVGIWLMGLCVG